MNGCAEVDVSRRKLIVGMVAFGFFVGCKKESELKTIPFWLPFNLDKSGSFLECEFSIEKKGFYDVSLEYFFDKKIPGDRGRVWGLVGGPIEEVIGKRINRGAPLLINVEMDRVVDTGWESISNKSVDRPRLSSWGADTLDATLVVVELEPGVYRVKVLNMLDAPDLAHVRAQILVSKAYFGK
ncbi:DUF5625 family protein [Paraburkholderia phytofirmans]|uniref:DUF5625 family protein n=1 Tax=Paraburkholderia TaxID=1822464 RepID=UPI0011DF52D8|nr:DUF5625 family protein [Paraburkholderia phytofirmans]